MLLLYATAYSTLKAITGVNMTKTVKFDTPEKPKRSDEKKIKRSLASMKARLAMMEKIQWVTLSIALYLLFMVLFGEG